MNSEYQTPPPPIQTLIVDKSICHSGSEKGIFPDLFYIKLMSLKVR